MNNPMGNPKSKEKDEHSQISGEEIFRRLGEISERLRLLEERLKNTHQKVQVVDETNMRKVGEISSKIKSVEEQGSSLRKEVEESKEIIRRLVKDMGQSAKVSDVRVLEKYINLVDITRLVTKEDVERYVDDYLTELRERKLNKMHNKD